MPPTGVLKQGRGHFMDAAGGRAFISCTPDNFVAVIDLATFEEIRRLPVGRPDGIALVVRKCGFTRQCQSTATMLL